MNNEVDIEIEIRNPDQINNYLSQEKGRQDSGQLGVPFSFQDFPDNISPRDKANQKPKRRLEDIPRSSALSEDGKTEKADGQIQELAQAPRRPPRIKPANMTISV